MKKKIKDLTDRDLKRICKKYRCSIDCPLIYFMKDYYSYQCFETRGWEKLSTNIYPEQKDYINKIKEEQKDYINKIKEEQKDYINKIKEEQKEYLNKEIEIDE